MTRIPSSPPPSRNLVYRVDIDGLRAVAILPVVCFHAGLGFPGGFVGVDVFFVISGFLITYIVQDEIDRGTFSLAGFWERRIRRLFPALAVVTAATVLAGWFLLLPVDFAELSQSVVAQTLMAANFYCWQESGYFAAPSELKPLLNIWSLAVEEQFYVLLPLLLMLLQRRRRRLWILGSLLIASFCWSVYSTVHYPIASFFLLPARAWELLLGVMLAQFYGRFALPRMAAEILGVAGMLSIAYACLSYSDHTPFPGLAAIPPCLGTAAVLASGSATPASLVQRLLSLRPLVFLGLLSYPLYLWHWPLFAFANYLRFEPLSLTSRLALIAASLCAAVFSWSVVEQPFRRRALCKTRRAAFTMAGLAVVAFLSVGLMIHLRHGVRSRFPEEVLRAADARSDKNLQSRLRHDLPVRRLQQQGLPRLGDLNDQRPPILAVIGDSHGDSLMPLLDSMCREFDVPAVGVSRSATLPLFCEQTEPQAHKRAFQNAVREQLENSPSLRHVLLVASWSYHPVETMTAENLERTVDVFSRLGMKVWIFRQVPEQKIDIPRALALSTLWNRDLSVATCRFDEYMQKRSRPDRLFAELDSETVSMLDPVGVFFPDTEACRISHDGRPFYFDSHHLSVAGAMSIRPVLAPMFERIAADR